MKLSKWLAALTTDKLDILFYRLSVVTLLILVFVISLFMSGVLMGICWGILEAGFQTGLKMH